MLYVSIYPYSDVYYTQYYNIRDYFTDTGHPLSLHAHAFKRRVTPFIFHFVLVLILVLVVTSARSCTLLVSQGNTTTANIPETFRPRPSYARVFLRLRGGGAHLLIPDEGRNFRSFRCERPRFYAHLACEELQAFRLVEAVFPLLTLTRTQRKGARSNTTRIITDAR